MVDPGILGLRGCSAQLWRLWRCSDIQACLDFSIAPLHHSTHQTLGTSQPSVQVASESPRSQQSWRCFASCGNWRRRTWIPSSCWPARSGSLQVRQCDDRFVGSPVVDVFRRTSAPELRFMPGVLLCLGLGLSLCLGDSQVQRCAADAASEAFGSDVQEGQAEDGQVRAHGPVRSHGCGAPLIRVHA